jgi:hypothetical protein
VDQALEQLDKKQLEEQMKTVADEITWVSYALPRILVTGVIRMKGVK